MNYRPLTLCALTGLAGLFLAAPGQAQTTQVITLDTSALSGLGTYSLDFQLLDGSLAADGNSAVTLSGFSSPGVTFDPAQAQSFGAGVSGALSTGLTLTDTDPSGEDEFQQAFTAAAGSQVQFTLRLSPQSLDTPTPDTFTFGVLDSSGSVVPTNGPTGGELVVSNFTSLPPPFDPAYHTVDTANSPNTPSLQPTITAPPAVPEASTTVSFGLLLVLGLGGVMIAKKRKKRSA